MTTAGGDARDEILARIRRALADAPAAPDAVAVARPGDELTGDPLIERFVQRIADYRATVTVCAGDDAAVCAAVAEAFARHDARAVAVPDDFPQAWRPRALAVYDAPGGALPDARALSVLDGVLTTCATAIAETGTIVLDAGPGQGPRALTLLPDLHVCVVDASRIVSGVAAAIGTLRRSVTGTRRPLTLIAGPSATSDIELDRVEGVHGPRTLEVIVRDDR
ncbi:MAG: lactate utilization protein [Conexibacter sp.]|nr:lactate utilization protein [Conexibacter sp.]